VELGEDDGDGQRRQLGLGCPQRGGAGRRLAGG
jgi:hypothetical protein